MGPTTLNPDLAYGRLAWHSDPNMTTDKAGFVIAPTLLAWKFKP